MRKIRVKLSSDAEEVYKYLNSEALTSKTERMILKSINQKVELIKVNPHFGNPVGKNKIPKEYKVKYGVLNLFRVELPGAWRMLYTLLFRRLKLRLLHLFWTLLIIRSMIKSSGIGVGSA